MQQTAAIEQHNKQRGRPFRSGVSGNPTGSSIRHERRRALVAEFSRLLGGEPALSADQLVLVKQAAELSVRIEGKRISDEEFVRLSNALLRVFGKLGIGKRQPPPVVPLRERLAESGR